MFVRLPVLPPNHESGAIVVDCKDEGGEGAGYPKTAQTHMYAWAPHVLAIEPPPITADGQQLPGCYITLSSVATAKYVALSAEDAMKLLKPPQQTD